MRAYETPKTYLSISAQQDLVFAVAALLSLVTPIAFIALALPYATAIYARYSSPRIRQSTADWLRESFQLRRKTAIRATAAETHVVSLPLFKTLYLGGELELNSDDASTRSVLAHEIGHFRANDYFVISSLIIVAFLVIATSFAKIPGAVFGCSVIDPAHPMFAASASEAITNLIELLHPEHHRMMFHLPASFFSAGMYLYLLKKGFFKNRAKTQSGLTFFAVWIVPSFSASVVRSWYEHSSFCNDEAWNILTSAEPELMHALVMTDLFWVVLQTLIFFGVLYTLGRVMRRREYQADSFAHMTLNDQYISYLRDRLSAPAWTSANIRESWFSKSTRPLIYPSLRQRLQFQLSGERRMSGTELANAAAWGFAASIVMISYFTTRYTGGREVPAYLLSWSTDTLGPIFVMLVLAAIAFWTARIVLEKGHAPALAYLASLAAGVLTSQFVFTLADYTIYTRPGSFADNLLPWIAGTSVGTIGLMLVGILVLPTIWKALLRLRSN